MVKRLMFDDIDELEREQLVSLYLNLAVICLGGLIGLAACGLLYMDMRSVADVNPALIDTFFVVAGALKFTGLILLVSWFYSNIRSR